MKKERKLNFTALLRAVDNHDANWLAAQPEDARKEFSPLTAMRMATGVQNDGMAAVYMLWLINRRVNCHLFDLKEPDLSFRLLASCGLQEGSLRREWLTGPRQASHANLALDLLAKHHPTASEGELRMLLSLYSRKDFAVFAADTGHTKEQVNECLKAYDKLVR